MLHFFSLKIVFSSSSSEKYSKEVTQKQATNQGKIKRFSSGYEGADVYLEGNPVWQKYLDRFPIINSDNFELNHAFQIAKKLQQFQALHIDEEIFKREQKRTEYWVNFALDFPFVPRRMLNPAYLPVKGNDFDDEYLVLDFFKEINEKIIDGRKLIIMMQGNKIEPDLKKKNFKNLFRGQLSPVFKHFILSENKIDDKRTYGKMEISPKPPCGFFFPVEWYIDNDFILFHITKCIKPNGSIVPWAAQDVIGGIPYNDRRPFFRFKAEDKCLRLFKQYYKKPEINSKRPVVHP